MQIEKDYLEKNKLYVILVVRNSGELQVYQANSDKIKKLIKGEKSPAKIEFDEVITQLELIEDFNKIVFDGEEAVVKNKEEKKNINVLKAFFSSVSPDKISWPKSWSSNKKKKNSDRAKEYIDNGLPVFFKPKGNEVVPYDDLKKSFNEYDLLVEKSALAKNKNLNFHSTRGNQIQVQVISNQYVGVYFQDAAQKKPNSHLHKTDLILVDTDEAGNYIAYMNNWFVYSDRSRKNVKFVNSDKKIAADEIKALQFQTKSVINSLAYYRNRALRQLLRGSLGKALLYKDSSGKSQDLSLSLQQLEIAKFLYDDDTTIVVKVVDGREIKFVWDDIEAFKEGEITLKFESKQSKVLPINSDTLQRIIVNRHGLEPDAAQNIIEALHFQKWISYPRADIVKAEDEPIKLLKDIKNFKGTNLEREILNIIDQSWKAFNSGKNFVENGKWILKSGDLTLETNAIKEYDKPAEYKTESFDIVIDDRGRTPEDLSKYLIDNDIGTPATRTALLAQLKAAGVINLRNGKYNLDRRGLYMVATYDYLVTKNIKPLKNIINEIRNATSKIELKLIIDDFIFLETTSTKEEIRARAEKLIEAEQDISYLENN